MGLGDLTDRRAVLDALLEFDTIGRNAFLAKYGYGRATAYFVQHDGKAYDSKPIAGAAHGYQHGVPLTPADFSGGDATVAARLRRLGFEVSGSPRVAGHWWDSDSKERFWVEIRHVEGIGTYLRCPLVRENGQPDPWYALVATVDVGDIVFHWSVREGQFVGASLVAEPARVTGSGEDAEYFVELVGFTPLPVAVDLRTLREKADWIYGLRDELERRHGRPLRLPFQFTQDRSQFRFMSNYFAKMPAALVAELFGSDLVDDLLDIVAPEPEQDQPGQTRTTSAAFLAPFKPKADTEYEAFISSKREQRSRGHETLVNRCALWLEDSGYTPARNAAVDLGLMDGSVIIEAKTIGATWATPIRQAVGQLYEYRYFNIARPDAELIFLSDRPVPNEWVKYLENDRNIGAMWPNETSGFELTQLARRSLKWRT